MDEMLLTEQEQPAIDQEISESSQERQSSLPWGKLAVGIGLAAAAYLGIKYVSNELTEFAQQMRNQINSSENIDGSKRITLTYETSELGSIAFLSDKHFTHLTDPKLIENYTDELIGYLEDHNIKNVSLLGDIFDFFETNGKTDDIRMNAIMNNSGVKYFFDNLTEYIKTTEGKIIVVTGNHDSNINVLEKHIISRYPAELFEFCHQINLTTKPKDGKKLKDIIAVHGNELDSAIHEKLKVFEDKFGFTVPKPPSLARAVDEAGHHLADTNLPLKGMLISTNDEIYNDAKRYFPEYRFITGHTHQASEYSVGGIVMYANPGNRVENSAVVTVDAEGLIELNDFTKVRRRLIQKRIKELEISEFERILNYEI